MVGPRIAAIQRDFHTSTSLPLMRLDTGKWDVAEDVSVPKEPITFAIAQVEIALTAALGTTSQNGLTETSAEVILIKSACEKYRDLPSAVATSFWNACMGLDRNIGDVYPEDAALISLKNVLFTSVGELCEQDELIRDRIAKLAALETRRMPSRDEREALQKVPQALAEEMTPRALDELAEAVEIVVETEKPPRLYRAKLVNWLNTISGAVDRAQKAEKRFDWLVKLAGRISGWFFTDAG